MAANPRTIRLPEASYDLLLSEAKRRGVDPDTLADELLRADLGDEPGDLDSALTRLADLRATLPELDGIALAREARDDLKRRSA